MWEYAYSKALVNHFTKYDIFSENRLLKEWTRSYFGVFSEAGFLDDPMYPEYFDNGIEIKRNQGCNFTTEATMPFDGELTHENKENHLVDVPTNQSWTKYYPQKVRKRKS